MKQPPRSSSVQGVGYPVPVTTWGKQTARFRRGGPGGNWSIPMRGDQGRKKGRRGPARSGTAEGRRRSPMRTWASSSGRLPSHPRGARCGSSAARVAMTHSSVSGSAPRVRPRVGSASSRSGHECRLSASASPHQTRVLSPEPALPSKAGLPGGAGLTDPSSSPRYPSGVRGLSRPR